jgi:drug/metabolite transporter (DMT)-like permease
MADSDPRLQNKCLLHQGFLEIGRKTTNNELHFHAKTRFGKRRPVVRAFQLFLLVLMSAFWATSYSVFKVLAPWLDAGGVATLRYALAGAIPLLVWRWLPGLAPRGRDLARTIVMGVIVFACSPRLQVAGVQKGQATDAAILVAFEPLIVSVAAAFFLREHVATRQRIGFVLGIFGVVVMAEVWRPDFHVGAFAADGLILLSFCCEAAYSIIGKPLLERAGLFKVLIIACLAGTIVNLLLDGIPTAKAMVLMPPRAWLLVLYLSLVCTLVGYSVWFVVVREVPVSTAALTIFVQPLLGCAIAVIWLGEKLPVGKITGGAVIMIGLLIGLSPANSLQKSARYLRSFFSGIRASETGSE